MSDKKSLPAKSNNPGRSKNSRDDRGPDAEWPEDAEWSEGSQDSYNQGFNRDPNIFDPLQAPALFDSIVFRRVVAYIMDGIILGLLWVIAWIFLSGLTVITFGLGAPLLIVLFILPLLYHSLFIGISGATPGMRFFDIEVRLLNGQRPDLGHAILLTILFYATIALTTALILLVALFNWRGRCLHDFLTGMLVVRRSVSREMRV